MTVFQKQDFAPYLQNLGINLTEYQQKQFQQYAGLLAEWNQKMNLTAITEENAIYEKHFLDSVLPLSDVTVHGKLCDIGSGAGFPSLPMKIIQPELQVTIVEPLGKRIAFLKHLCAELQLEVRLVNARAEDYVKEQREIFDIVTARAVANLPMLSELCIPFVKKKGLFLAMKGAEGYHEHEAAKHAIKCLGCEFQDGYEHELSDGSKRINLVYIKRMNTPKQYPRAFAKIKKQPL